eukprot:845233_1
MVEEVSFENNISQIFEHNYGQKTAETAVNAFKTYLEEYQAENGFNFKIIEEDVCGKAKDPTQSILYSTFLKILHTNGAFETDKDKHKLYLLLVSVVNGISIQYNQPWNLQNHVNKPKKKKNRESPPVKTSDPHKKRVWGG